MAEIKNSFLRSKMNKDLDDRLIPNGEYRDAKNISVGKSEEDDIGALENVRGNILKTDFGLTNVNIEVIGYYSDESNNRFIVFLTDYDDTNDNPTLPSSTNNCYIYQFTPANNTPTLLVSGIFLNFSKSNPITGVDLIEDLLFFTDNRNQPRKINIKKALSSSVYYTQESDISVATYNPYEGISLLNTVFKNTTTTSGSTSTLTFTDTTGIIKGMSVVEYGNADLQPEDYVHVVSFTSTVVTLSKAVGNIASGDTIYFLSTTMTGEDITLDFNGGATWPGDPNFLENKFVRFSYRFKFDDGEYSIMAPFTQIGFIPKQKGYFLEGQESSTFRSTILEFMENGVQNIDLIIPLPDVQNNIGTESTSTYKISAIDILYKESDGLSIKVLETIESIGTSTTSNKYIYRYQSRKPFKTLPSEQTVRVYDKVPVKALGQAVSGNRVIYGNFLDKYTAPSLLNYRVGIAPKNTTSSEFTTWSEYPNHSLKQNRTYQVGFILSDKYGRQSDVILSLVDINTETDAGIIYGGSTIYAPYHPSNSNPTVKNWFGDALRLILNTGISSGLNGNPSTTGETNGQPGLYANPIADGFNIAGTAVSFPAVNKYRFTLNGSVTTGLPIDGSSLRGQYIDFVKVTDVTPPAGGTTYYEITCDGPINQEIYSLSSSTPNPDNKFAYNINSQGWYSYKVVVKQQQQDYYNVFLPGIITGYPQQIFGTQISKPDISQDNGFTFKMTAQSTPIFSTKNQRVQVGMLATSLQIGEAPAGGAFEAISTLIVNKDQSGEFTKFTTNTPTNIVGPQPTDTISFSWPENPVAFEPDPVGQTANVVLINDNINKIPRDLSEVGPNDKTFRSSVRLFARVNNNESNNNTQWYPGTSSDTASSVSNASDSNFIQKSIPDFERQGVYQLDTNPLICRISVIDSYETTATNTRVFSDITGSDIMTFATAPSPAIIPGMMIAWSNQNTTFLGAEGDEFNEGTIFGVVTAVNSPTEIVTKLAIVVNYQNAILRFVHTKGYPLCAGPPRPKGTGFASWDFMQPTLAVFETDPVESLLDIFWETNTSGLIADLNKEVSTSFNGATGWGSYTWTQPESLTVNSFVVENLSPVSSSGSTMPNTSIVSYSVTDAGGTPVTSDFTLEPDTAGGATTGAYRIKLNSLYTFLNNATVREFTLTAVVKNNLTDEISSPISITGALSNVNPSFTTASVTKNKSFVGTVVTLTGVNGGADTSGTPPANTSELRWTITSVTFNGSAITNNIFTLNQSTGVISKPSSSGATGTYVLLIKLEDAWNGSSANGGSVSVTQQIILDGGTVGSPFYASDPGSFNQTCQVLPGPPPTGPQNPNCGTGNGGNPYYNITQGTATIQVGDVIATGPNASSPKAGQGVYSYDCGQSGLGNRKYFSITASNPNTGVVTAAGVC